MAKYKKRDDLNTALDDEIKNPPAPIMQKEASWVDLDYADDHPFTVASLASQKVEEMNPFETIGADVPPMEKVKSGAIVAMNGTVDELHAVQTRLSEIVPFLNGAIAKASGDTKAFLESLSDQL